MADKKFRVKMTLTLRGVVINGEHKDLIKISTEEELTEKDFVDLTMDYVSDPKFLKNRVAGLTEIKESEIEIESI